jgi:misacylated tRNA(Ala) deacylase
MHSALHLLCSIVPAAVTGGSIRDGSGRLDFDLPEPIDRGELAERLNRVIEEDHPVSLQWISEEELNAQPELVRTLSVRPPTGSGIIRLVHFEGVDLQPCGGTHVASTAEIGPVRIKKIEKKGKLNRRITLELDA